MTPPSRSIPPDAAYLDELEATVLERLDAGEESCVLDVAERGGITLAEVGDLLGPDHLGMERVRQIETRALHMLKRGLLRGRVDPDLAEETFAERDTKPAFLRRGGAGSKR